MSSTHHYYNHFGPDFPEVMIIMHIHIHIMVIFHIKMNTMHNEYADDYYAYSYSYEHEYYA